ncbi:FAD-NAD(P)-binding protein [Raoultella sp. Ech2A]|uniref:FAD-NAD(P)-binding protein n=1 Tax=Raoultella sp. Ech2A TaxID=2996539 RepID=UPI0024C0485E|nr:FAD-NAD(P)-binding protein [Raoultella sp. Ech2A]MDJ1654501.1 FAD-NAD(P)-binding protein [Raoultella sp. Ech2A]
MKKIAIIGAGPTGIYTFHALLQNAVPLAVSIYEQADRAGVGMPYSKEDTARMMLANIASIEIPPIFATYIDWLQGLSAEHLARYGVRKESLHIRQFLPRLLLGEYFHDQFLQLVATARRRGFEVALHESCRVEDLQVTPEGVMLCAQGVAEPAHFDLAVIATGHVWPDDDTTPRAHFPSPWSGLMSARIAPCRVGIMGTSLSGIDAAMAVAAQHGEFVEAEDRSLSFRLDRDSEALEMVMMSRSGILPEADFYCPIPYEPLTIASDEAIARHIAAGSEGLLDRVFALMAQEIDAADPQWSREIALRSLNADSFHDAWFAARRKSDPFRWAEANLIEVERNKRDRRTVAWRYAILRLHEAVQAIVPHLDSRDSERFSAGLARVFIDNYAAIPSQSIRRLLALHEAGVISILPLGPDYAIAIEDNLTEISVGQCRYAFEVFIDARGQKPLKTKDLPFPTLRRQILAAGDAIPDVGEDYTLLEPEIVRGRIAFGALPYLMHDRPFVQGLTVCAEIGAAMAKAASQPAARPRRWLPFIER